MFANAAEMGEYCAPPKEQRVPFVPRVIVDIQRKRRHRVPAHFDTQRLVEALPEYPAASEAILTAIQLHKL